MTRSRRPFVNVDDLSRQVSVEQVLTHFGLAHEIVHRTGSDIRTRCFLNCQKSEPTGDRALAIKDEDVKRWCCHVYNCEHKAGGNLVSLIDLLLPGEHGNGRPRGERFKEVLRTLESIVGNARDDVAAAVRAPVQKKPAEKVKVNPPLSESPNEKARGLVNLHEKFITDPAAMNPAGASYFRRRSYLTPEVAEAWHMGYLPRDAGGNSTGGTMRGKIVYQLHNEEAQVIGYCGRDPDFERKHADWLRIGRQGTEPVKVTFPKGLHRGLLLYGEHRLRKPEVLEQVKSQGTLFIVEGPNDVIRLSVLGAPAVAICSNRLTVDQVEKLAQWARDFENIPITLLFDLDPEGEAGMREALWQLAQRCAVRVGLSRSMSEGKIQNKQPEELTHESWMAIMCSRKNGI